ncbi:hypothetical protein SAMN05216409_109100 [Pseudomonas lutea]|uniref:Uncharacterized protein n=1 Tax=Pseudomonas lutea TaxID=243924 RepID=A0A9X8ME89_9PSED|nr:hypothetical protein SAMN05216409_109100 [Pseudomonas lutea]
MKCPHCSASISFFSPAILGPALWGVVTAAAVFIAIARLEKH